MYWLAVFYVDCGIPCYPIWENSRPLTFEECRANREPTKTYFLFTQNELVWVVCRRIEE